MNSQCEVLDTVKGQFNSCGYTQKFTNTEGKVFLLDYQGKVSYWDPFGGNKEVQIQDLREIDTSLGWGRRRQ